MMAIFLWATAFVMLSVAAYNLINRGNQKETTWQSIMYVLIQYPLAGLAFVCLAGLIRAFMEYLQ